MGFRPTRAGIAAGLLALVVALVCVRLGLWQLDRLDQRRARNAAYAEAIALPVLELGPEMLEAVRRAPADYVYRRARVRGQPVDSAALLWRGRSLAGRPGVNVLTPYRADRATILVNRGWLPSPDAARVDPAALEEEAGAEPVGVLVPFPAASERALPRVTAAEGRRVLSVQVPDRAVLGERFPDLLPLYVQQLPASGDPPTPARLPLPDLGDEGPHLGYAVQWFAFAAIALLGFAGVVFLRSRGPTG